MKQHITQEQWDTVGDEQKFLFQWGHLRDEPTLLLLKTELPNIGQMIEFLGNGWHSDIETSSLSDVCYMPDIEELCDALWDSVKARLSTTNGPWKCQENSTP